jgi:hypothetical protein
MSDVLGLDHPLRQASDALDVSVRQLLAVAAMLAGSLPAAAAGATWARSLTLAAAVVLVGAAPLAALRAQARRDCAVDLIIEGRGALPIGIVQRQCRRLVRERTRRILARTLQSMTEQTLRRRAAGSLSPRVPLHRPLIIAVQGELGAVAQLLRSRRANIRGVAFCERLLTDGDSPLYGRDLAALRARLSRARSLLEDG